MAHRWEQAQPYATSAIPYIGENGNWWVNQEDTGVIARGPEGPAGKQGNPGVGVAGPALTYEDLTEEQKAELTSYQSDLIQAAATTALECASDAQSSAEAAANSVEAALLAQQNAELACVDAKQYSEAAQTHAHTAEATSLLVAEARTEASTHAANAATYAASAGTYAQSATNAASEAAASKAAAESSVQGAANARTAAENAASAAKTSEANAKSYYNNITENIGIARDAADAANASASAAAESVASIAGAVETTAQNAMASDASAFAAQAAATEAQRYKEQVGDIAAGITGGLLPMGTITFEELMAVEKVSGHMYDVSDDFVTDATFREGAGKAYPAGTNVYCTGAGQWDCMTGTCVAGVKGAAEEVYRKGFVEITPENIGLGLVPNVATNDQTPTYAMASVLSILTSGETLKTAFAKLSKAVSDLIKHLANVDNPHNVTKAQVGLDKVDNTADADKPISDAAQAALDAINTKLNGALYIVSFDSATGTLVTKSADYTG